MSKKEEEEEEEKDVCSFKHGDFVTCTIEDCKITDGRISIDRDGKIYICQNFKYGCPANNLFGYSTSWIIYDPKHNRSFSEYISRNNVTYLRPVLPFKLPEVKEDEIVNGFDSVTTAWMNDGSSRI